MGMENKIKLGFFFKIEKKERIDIDNKNIEYPSLYDFIEEELSDPNFIYSTENLPENIWIYNYNNNIFKSIVDVNVIDNDNGDEPIIDISNCNIKESIKNFEKELIVKEFMEKFEKHYPEYKIKICFGLYNIWI